MKNIKYRKLSIDECQRINEINPSQFIKRAWREIEGEQRLIEINYHDIDWPNGYNNHLDDFKNTLLDGGCAYGAFNCDDKLYICAGSAEETIAFYFAIGCKQAMEIQLDLYNEDPRDYQLEYDL